MIRNIIIFLALGLAGNTLFAADGEDDAPQSDVGMSAESAPDKDGFEMPEVTFSLIRDEPVIDGFIDDSFWDQARQFQLEYELYPTRLADAVVDTRAWVGVGKTHLYVAFEAFDPKPDRLRSALRERDATKEDDYVSIVIDPTGALAKKYEFRVNPHGSLSDVLQDTISDRYIYDWDTDWEGAAQINANGYTVEIAIPHGSIRAPEKSEGQDHKGAVILKRSYPRRVDRTLGTFFLYSQQLEKPAATDADPTLVPGAQQTAETPEAESLATPPAGNPPEGGIETKTSASDTGTGSVSAGGAEQREDSNADEEEQPFSMDARAHYIFHADETRDIGGSFDQVDEHDRHEGGFDLDIHFDSAKTLSLTVNPNYTEVEADIARQSINNPFVIFKPEKRRFFKSTVEYYNTLIPTVYTRNVIQPRWGASYIGDAVSSSFGAFGVSDDETTVIVPDTFGSDQVELLERSESAGTRFRYSKDKRSFGLIGTLRSADGYHNAVAGVDGLLDISPDDKMRYQFLYSNTEYPQRFAEDLCEEDGCTIEPQPEFCPLGNCDTNAQVLRADFERPLSDYAFKIRYKHDGPDALYWVTLEDYAPDFRADLGLQNSIDIRTVNLAYGRKWYVDTFSDDEGKSRIRGYLVYTHSRTHSDDEQVEDGIGIWGEFRGSYQSVFRIGKRWRERAVNRINQNSLEAGDNAPLFDEDYWQWYFETSPWAHWTLNFDGRWGETADADNLVLGDLTEIKPKIAYRLDKWQFILGVTYRDFDVDGSQLYSERFASFTTSYRHSNKASHRFLYLDDLTRQDTERWLGSALDKEIERELEYSFIYKPNRKLSLLTGFKAGYDYESDIGEGDITNREVYFKLEVGI